MAAISAPSASITALLRSGVTIAGYNSPQQTVIAGAAEDVRRVIEECEANGLRATPLPVSHAFHTEAIAAAEPLFREALSEQALQPIERSIVSTVSGTELSRDQNIPELLCHQLTTPVRFIEAITQAQSRVDLWIEVGPGQEIGRAHV